MTLLYTEGLTSPPKDWILCGSLHLPNITWPWPLMTLAYLFLHVCFILLSHPVHYVWIWSEQVEIWPDLDQCHSKWLFHTPVTLRLGLFSPSLSLIGAFWNFIWPSTFDLGGLRPPNKHNHMMILQFPRQPIFQILHKLCKLAT